AAYYYDKMVKNPASVGRFGNNTLNVVGGRLSGDVPMVGGLGYDAEYMQNFGRNNIAAGQPAYDGNAYFVGVKYGHEVSAMPVRAHGEYGAGSDDFTSIAPGRRFGLIWGEHTSVAGAPSNLNRTTSGGALGTPG